MAELGLWRSYRVNSMALVTNVTLTSFSSQNCAGKRWESTCSLIPESWRRPVEQEYFTVSGGKKRHTDAANGSKYSTTVSMYNCIKTNKKLRLSEVTAG